MFKLGLVFVCALFKSFRDLCRAGIEFMLVSFKTLWFMFCLGSIEGWTLVDLGLV